MSRRIAGRVLRTSRAGGFALSSVEVQTCVDGITSRFLSSSLRRRLGELWLEHGEKVVKSGLEDQDRRSDVDDDLDRIVIGRVS
jgi:hypothetical protein